MSENMRGLFFIVKGQYTKGAEPSFNNDITGGVSYIGGFDPYSEDTAEWYMLLDSKTFNCVSCGRDIDKMLKGVYNTIKRYKGSAERYFKSLKEANYGKGTHQSPAMRCLYNAIYTYYGEYFSDEVSEMEDQAYKDLEEVLRDSKPINKTRKIVKKAGGIKKTCEETPVKEVVEERPHKLVRPVMKKGIKKLSV